MGTFTHPLLPLAFCSAFTACNPSPEQELQQWVESLPELPPALAATLDTATMATREPELQPVALVPQHGAAALAPCCSRETIKELLVEYEITHCRPLSSFGLGYEFDIAMGGTAHGASPETNAKHFRFGIPSKAGLVRPWVCTTSIGPWPAIFKENWTCQYGEYYTLTVIGPTGPIFFPTWQAEASNLPAGIHVVDCQLRSNLGFRCSPLSQCECVSNMCAPPQDCGCPLF